MKRYLGLPEGEKTVYRIGRRTGIMHTLQDLDSSVRRNHVRRLIEQYGIDSSNVDLFIDGLLKNFI
ncbi:MAG: hypothetical protein GX759_06120 [Thermoanaerobacterales bacterium]|nr:hypothetical protein [Thermoanaerobacterales bacterium]